MYHSLKHSSINRIKKKPTQNPKLISCPEYHFTADLGEKEEAILNKPGQNNFLEQQISVQVSGCSTTAAHSIPRILQAKPENFLLPAVPTEGRTAQEPTRHTIGRQHSVLLPTVWTPLTLVVALFLR